MKKISLFSPSISNNEINAVKKILQSGFWSSGAGSGKVLEFEKKFLKYTNAKECIAVDSGTAALDLALNVIDVTDKDILVPSFTFISTVNAIVHNKGNPIFVDIDEKTLCMDPDDLKKKITKNSKVVIPVHMGGIPCKMDAIKKIADAKKITIVEDAAHACGSHIKGKKIGSVSDFTCFSFHPVKNLSMPKGGAITLNFKNKQIKKKLQSLRWCGIDNRKEAVYDITNLGFNYYMDEISASIGIIQLNKIEKLNKIRKNIATRYYNEISLKEKMPLMDGCSYHLYWILVKNREKFRKIMKEKGIETGIHYLPAHLMSLYKSKIKLPITEKVSKNIVTLPMHSNLKNTDISFIIKNINSRV
jgi:perosamine synthetase